MNERPLCPYAACAILQCSKSAIRPLRENLRCRSGNIAVAANGGEVTQNDWSDLLAGLGVDDAIAGIVRDVWMLEIATQAAFAGHFHFLHHTSGRRILDVTEGFRSRYCRVGQSMIHQPSHDF